MNDIQTMTAQLESGFAMPTSAQIAASSGIHLAAGTGMATVAGCAPVFDARVRLVTGDVVRTPFPGPTAWSPPTG
jgi:hypothetical protein